MKKGFVALLLALAVIVLISPAIVGRFAERSMDENLDWAATESQEVVISSQGFDRGWFFSAGQHRVELRDGELRSTVLALVGAGFADELPVLIIDTRLDHGLVPLSSMSRDRGSLKPGLGSAISTLKLEYGDGDTIDIPGTIYSEVGLTGELSTNYVVDSGSLDLSGETANWGDTDILVTTNPANGKVEFSGVVNTLSFASSSEQFNVGKIEFSGDQHQSRFGFAVGDIDIDIRSIAFGGQGGPFGLGPFTLGTSTDIDDDRVSLQSSLRLENTPFIDFGTAAFTLDLNLIDVDGVAFGNITDAFDELRDSGSAEDFLFVVEDDLRRLLAAGLEVHVERFDIELPQGSATSNIHLELAESDLNGFAWTSTLLALDASAEVRMPAALVNHLTARDPQLHAFIAGGYLRKNGDFYEMKTAFKKGVLTVNGRPMPLPIPGLQ